jgi:hypothetical protein
MPTHGSSSTYTHGRSPRRSVRPTTESWRWCLRRGGRNFQHPRQHLRGGEKRTTKKALRPLAPSSAPLEVILDFATCHKPFVFFRFMAGTTGLEPATSAVTGQRSDQLSYVPRLFFNNLVIRHIESSVSQLSLFSLFSIISLLWTQFWASVDTTWTPRWTPKSPTATTS